MNHTPAGVAVVLRTRVGDKGGAILEIEDSGPGIDPEDLPYIFDRFYRADKARPTNKGGAGLGLPIAQKIVEAHGGKITVESTPGQGTIFRLWLPSVK
jgi:signal transduction histidine kinase